MATGFFHATALATKAPTPLVAQCGKCGLYRNCHTPKMVVDGEGRRKVLLVGEAPGKTEDERGKPFVGETGRLLEGILRDLGVSMRKDCWITNSLICRPPGNEIKNKKMIEWCRPNLLRTIRELQPERIVLLGASAVRSLIGWLWKEDVKAIGRWVGWQIPVQRINAWVYPVWHPSYLLRADAKKPTTKVLEALFRRYLKAAFRGEGRPYPEGPPDRKSRVRLLLNPGEAAAAIRAFTKRGLPVAFDFETDRLKPDAEDSTIVCCSLSDGKRTVAFPWEGEVVREMERLLLSDVPKIGYSAKFETRWCLARLGLAPRNWVWDGMLAAHALDNRPDICSLKFQAFVLLGEESYDDTIKSYLRSEGGGNGRNRIREAGLESLLTYCGLDALLEWEVAQIQIKQLGFKRKKPAPEP